MCITVIVFQLKYKLGLYLSDTLRIYIVPFSTIRQIIIMAPQLFLPADLRAWELNNVNYFHSSLGCVFLSNYRELQNIFWIQLFKEWSFRNKMS